MIKQANFVMEWRKGQWYFVEEFFESPQSAQEFCRNRNDDSGERFHCVSFSLGVDGSGLWYKGEMPGYSVQKFSEISGDAFRGYLPESRFIRRIE